MATTPTTFGTPTQTTGLGTDPNSYYSESTTTQLPAWYNQATQGLANYGTQILNTQAANNQNINDANNLLQGTVGNSVNNLNSIAGNATNPWLANGQANTATPLGNLFQNQTNLLNAQLPDIQAQADASGIASGNFGGLRGLTASNNARAQAVNTLATNQATAWNQAQNTGLNAATGAVNAANVGLAGEANQQNLPWAGITNYANILGSISTPKTQYSTPSPYQQYGATNAAFGPNAAFFSGQTTPFAANTQQQSIFQPTSTSDSGVTVFKEGGYADGRRVHGGLPTTGPRPMQMGEVPQSEIDRMRQMEQDRRNQEAYRRSQFVNQPKQPSILEQIFGGLNGNR
jgi:hypothetical protein